MYSYMYYLNQGRYMCLFYPLEIGFRQSKLEKVIGNNERN